VNNGLLTLYEALLMVIAERTSQDDAIYLRKSQYPWHKDSNCLIFNLAQLTNIAEDPLTAKQYEMTYILTVEQMYGIIYNANLQLGKANMDELVKAFNHYYRNDAFIEF
jgi:hypothetical protein